jgi:hypothetical protein
VLLPPQYSVRALLGSVSGLGALTVIGSSQAEPQQTILSCCALELALALPVAAAPVYPLSTYVLERDQC